MRKESVMKRLTILLSVFCACVYAADTKQLSDLERQQKFYQRTGGLIRCPGIGYLKIINTQNKIGADSLRDVAALITKEFKIEYRIKDSERFDISKRYKGNESCTLTLFIIEDNSMPISLQAPEEGWAMVNVSPLIADEGNSNKVSERFRKMFMRSASALLGAGYSSLNISVMQRVSSLKELDSINRLGLDPQSLMQTIQYISKIGIKPSKQIPYIRACKEGWAPPPTNATQKAIWDKVRSDKERGPTNPIEIPMPKKK
jgi:hypothetical protein